MVSLPKTSSLRNSNHVQFTKPEVAPRDDDFCVKERDRIPTLNENSLQQNVNQDDLVRQMEAHPTRHRNDVRLVSLLSRDAKNKLKIIQGLKVAATASNPSKEELPEVPEDDLWWKGMKEDSEKNVSFVIHEDSEVLKTQKQRNDKMKKIAKYDMKPTLDKGAQMAHFATVSKSRESLIRSTARPASQKTRGSAK